MTAFDPVVPVTILEQTSMLTLVTAVLFVAVIVIALYVFGVFNTPYLDAFRFTFYLLFVLLVLTVWFGVTQPPNEGYNPTRAVDKLH